jgi:hypothetical protein
MKENLLSKRRDMDGRSRKKTKKYTKKRAIQRL